MRKVDQITGAGTQHSSRACIGSLPQAQRIAQEFAISVGVNCGRVHSFLYRGGQPTEAGLRKLKSLGVDTIIDLRQGKSVKEESKTAESLGMRHIHLPVDGNGYPTAEQIGIFMQEVTGAARRWSNALADGDKMAKPAIFIHCARGADRTGSMIGVARVALEGWTYDQAYREMRKYHFNGKQTQLADVVREQAGNQAGNGASNQNANSLNQILFSAWTERR